MSNNRFAKTLFHVGRVGDGWNVTPAVLASMVERFQELRGMGLVLPVRLEHQTGAGHPVASVSVRRLALDDRRLVGYVSDMRTTPDDQALRVEVTFLRERGRNIAQANRMGLSPVFTTPQVTSDGGFSGQLVAIDLCSQPADRNQGPFLPVTQMRHTSPKPQRGVKRMSEVKMPLLNDAQIAVLKYLDGVRAKMGPANQDWWPTAIKLLWPDQAVEILGTDPEQERDGSFVETAPEFAAMNLDRGSVMAPLYDEPCRQVRQDNGDPAMREAKEYVDQQAARMGGMIRK